MDIPVVVRRLVFEGGVRIENDLAVEFLHDDAAEEGDGAGVGEEGFGVDVDG